jgi:hypothetical protein
LTVVPGDQLTKGTGTRDTTAARATNSNAETAAVQVCFVTRPRLPDRIAAA